MTTLTPAPAYVDESLPVPSKKKKLTKAKGKHRKVKALQETPKPETIDDLMREFEMSRKSSLRGRPMWQEVCNEIKILQMPDELEAWETKTNRILNQKDEKISLLLEDLKETEEMHKRSFAMQLQVMDYLTDIFQVFKDCARLRYEAQAEKILHDFYDKTSKRDQFMQGFQRNCENVMHDKNRIFQETIKGDFDIYLDKRDDCVNSEIEKRYCLRDSIALKMQNLQKQLWQFLDTLRNSSLDVHKYERANALMQRQRTFVVETKKLNDTEAQSIRLHEELQRELTRRDMEAKRKINDLKLEYAYFVRMRKSIEKQMKMDRERTHEKLKVLTTECYGMCRNYRKLQKYGELLLSLSANSRKLQTESEKVVSWGDFQKLSNSSLHGTEPFVVQVLDLKSHVDLSESEMKIQMDLMKNFWHRQSLAEAQNVVLEEKIQQLTKENQHYIKLIRSLSKADNVSDLQEALRIQCVLEEEPQCPGLSSWHL